MALATSLVLPKTKALWIGIWADLVMVSNLIQIGF
jgi:hypothetical protein